MTIETLLKDKTIKAKEKTTTISQWLIEQSMDIDELIHFASATKDGDKATCIEALEYATQHDKNLHNENLWSFAIATLESKAPRVKWESAKVIGNIAQHYQSHLTPAIKNLLINAKHEGTVVRWAAAFALGEILKLNTKHNKELLPTIQALSIAEEQNGVRKKYLEAFKQLEKTLKPKTK